MRSWKSYQCRNSHYLVLGNFLVITYSLSQNSEFWKLSPMLLIQFLNRFHLTLFSQICNFCNNDFCFLNFFYNLWLFSLSIMGSCSCFMNMMANHFCMFLLSYFIYFLFFFSCLRLFFKCSVILWCLFVWSSLIWNIIPDFYFYFLPHN